jgi:hypothetical protein
MTLQKQDGDILPILCGEIWYRCFASLVVNTTSIHNEEVKLLTSTYDNFIQTIGIRDGDSHCEKILMCFYDNLDTSDPNDPDVIIKVDTSNDFNTTDRANTLHVLRGRVSRDCVSGIKKGQGIPNCETLLGYLTYSVI